MKVQALLSVALCMSQYAQTMISELDCWLYQEEKYPIEHKYNIVVKYNIV